MISIPKRTGLSSENPGPKRGPVQAVLHLERTVCFQRKHYLVLNRPVGFANILEGISDTNQSKISTAGSGVKGTLRDAE